MQDDQFQVVLGPDPAGVGVHPVFEHVTHRRRCFLVAQSRGEHRWVLRQDVDAVGLLITLERGAPVLDVGHEAPVLRTSPAKSADSVSGASAGEVRHTGAESAASGEPSAAAARSEAKTTSGQTAIREPVRGPRTSGFLFGSNRAIGTRRSMWLLRRSRLQSALYRGVAELLDVVP